MLQKRLITGGESPPFLTRPIGKRSDIEGLKTRGSALQLTTEHGGPRDLGPGSAGPRDGKGRRATKLGQTDSSAILATKLVLRLTAGARLDAVEDRG